MAGVPADPDRAAAGGSTGSELGTPLLASAPLGRRFLALVYEALLITAVIWAAAFPYGFIEQALGATHFRTLYQIYLATVAGLYFVLQWTHGGQTLALKTWRLRIVARDGTAVTPRQAVMRYVAALLLFGVSFLWAFVDRERLFLHDRMAKTKIVRTV